MELTAHPLTAAAFAPFGDVIQLAGAQRLSINDGRTTRFHDLCCIDTTGRPLLSLFRSEPLLLPHRVHTMERHPRGSQAFLPLTAQPYLILVAGGAAPPCVADLRLFHTSGWQGVNFHRNTWHHTHIVLGTTRDFIVVDGGGGDNLETAAITEAVWIPIAAGEPHLP